MDLGAFSVSLSVKDLAVSTEFYKKLGFFQFGGDGKNYVIMKNEDKLIGIFQGMFEGNILTFNPGWNQEAKNLEHFSDIRKIQQHFKAEGIAFENEVDENSEGPASFMIKDPDGNLILVDQHR